MIGSEIGWQSLGFRSEPDQPVGAISSLLRGHLWHWASGGNPAASARLLFVVVAVNIVVEIDSEVVGQIARSRKGRRCFTEDKRFFG